MSNYRPEIDGLRALAVLAVLGFHSGLVGLKGGFLGVDVFFVISGFLITSIILAESDRGSFTVAGFYERRVRRILPALYVVLIICIPCVLVLTYPTETLGFARSLASALFFLPNVYFWRTVSYFDVASERLPLLHTWSLGVEEQFYLIFPVVVIIMRRLGVRFLLLGLLLAALLSLFAAEWAWRSGRAATGFFLVPFRAWELLTGSLAAVLLKHCSSSLSILSLLHQRILADIGLLVIALSLLFFDATVPMPSAWGVLPVVGTALVLLFAQSQGWTGRLLSTRLLVGIGLISYSAYLWHQPVLAFLRLLNRREPTIVGPANPPTRCPATTFGSIPMVRTPGIQFNGCHFLGD